jgi:hypothetical protein
MPARCSAIIAARASRQEPRTTDRHQLGSDLLLHRARNTAKAFQLDENNDEADGTAVYDLDVGKPAPHTTPLLKYAG